MRSIHSRVFPEVASCNTVQSRAGQQAGSRDRRHRLREFDGEIVACLSWPPRHTERRTHVFPGGVPQQEKEAGDEAPEGGKEKSRKRKAEAEAAGSEVNRSTVGKVEKAEKVQKVEKGK
eukprot:4017957-Pyramimonas_sp.AAC.1